MVKKVLGLGDRGESVCMWCEGGGCGDYQGGRKTAVRSVLYLWTVALVMLCLQMSKFAECVVGVYERKTHSRGFHLGCGLAAEKN